MNIVINEKLASKVKEVVSCGLSSGLGIQEPGKMCVEAAVNYACGLPHNDNPPCVGYAVRAFKIALNDKNWSSNEARGRGMLKIAIAQLGSNQIDQCKFVELLAIKTVSKSLSRLMRSLGYEEGAVKCEQASDLQTAEYAAKYAAKYAEYAAKYTAEYAKYAEYAAEYTAKYAEYAAEYAAEYTAKYAEYAAKYAAKYAEYAAKYTAEYTPDAYYIELADLCLECLIELKSPGCEFLYLCES